MHLLYGAEQGRVGAELGAKVCQEYKEKIKPKGLSHDADVLFEKGLLAKKLSPIEEERLPDNLRKTPAKREAARNELNIGIPATTPYDYEDVW